MINKNLVKLPKEVILKNKLILLKKIAHRGSRPQLTLELEKTLEWYFKNFIEEDK